MTEIVNLSRDGIQLVRKYDCNIEKKQIEKLEEKWTEK